MDEVPRTPETANARRSARIPGFHRMSMEERRAAVAAFAGLDDEAVVRLADTGALPADLAERMIENAVGAMPVPIGIATNLRIDGIDRLVPMATEESSVVAAVCNAARLNYDDGGFITSATQSLMIAQIQLTGVSDPLGARLAILERRERICEICNACDPVLVRHGGGFADLEVRIVESRSGPMVITHIVVDTRDAMGANAVNTMAETLAPHIEGWTGGKVYLRILSNLADRRLARARAVWRAEALGGPDVVEGIVQASHFAEADPYRAATHNKGVMNGVGACVLATGNDTRAIEAGAHAYAARNGRYASLARFERNDAGDLVGTLEMPLAIGLVGGATRVHPVARTCVAILGAESAQEMARIFCAVGLAQSFAALKALATDGIQKGHMGLHAQNLAMMAGAVGEEIDAVAGALVASGSVRMDLAETELARLRNEKG